MASNNDTVELKKMKLMILDDDHEDVLLIKSIINKNMNYEKPEVLVAHNMQDALELCYTQEIDICLLDFRLGKRDGIRAFNEFRESGFIFPVIFLTGQGDEKIAVNAMKSGAFDYFSKNDLNSVELVKSIRTAVRAYKSIETIQDLLDY